MSTHVPVFLNSFPIIRSMLTTPAFGLPAIIMGAGDRHISSQRKP